MRVADQTDPSSVELFCAECRCPIGLGAAVVFEDGKGMRHLVCPMPSPPRPEGA